MPGLPDPRQRKNNHTDVAERFLEAKKLSLTPTQFRLLVDAILSGFGKKSLVDSGNDEALYFAQELTLSVMRMSEEFRTVQGVQSIFQSWFANDWRGQKGELPTSVQFKEHASAMADGVIGRKNDAPPVTFKQWCHSEFNTDYVQGIVSMYGISEMQLRSQYEQSILH